MQDASVILQIFYKNEIEHTEICNTLHFKWMCKFSNFDERFFTKDEKIHWLKLRFWERHFRFYKTNVC